VRPLAVIEWKHNERRVSKFDLEWLLEFSALSADFVGYAVRTTYPTQGGILSCARIQSGQSMDLWVVWPQRAAV
jgi:hypothetical protein